MSNLKRVLMLAMVAIFAMAIMAACGSKTDNSSASEPIDTGLPADTISNEAFKDLFPLQYESFNATKDMSDTKFGGSVPTSKFDQSKEPLLPILFNGYGFAWEYNEDRGHVYANEDIEKIKRINDKSPGACLTCKSTAVPKLLEEGNMGDGYWKANFRAEVLPAAKEMGHSPIGCTDCHDPQTMELRVTRPSFAKAMEAQGIDISNPTKNEMRTYVCAQCHVEYYFESTKGEVVFPWNNGFKPEDMYEYYETTAKDAGWKSDWKHNISGAPMLKAQHPEFETWNEGTHGKNGVSCSDCHMPYERSDGNKKVSSHNWTSPLKNIEASCRTCHADKTAEELKNNVESTQETHKDALDKAEEIGVTAHYYVNRMITAKAPADKIAEAQELVRKGQWFVDIVAAENSTGFHNPQGMMDSLKMGSEAFNETIILGTEELVKLGVNIDELKAEIEKATKAVLGEADNFKKREHATNVFFPAQQPPAAPAPAATK